VEYHFDLAEDFSTNVFPSIKSHQPGSGVTLQRTNKIYGFIPEAQLIDFAHASAIKMRIILNSKLTKISWTMVE
jgi:hypothetical protein